MKVEVRIPLPVGCLEDHPTTQSLYLSGVAISLSAIARTQAIDVSHLSRIFSGERTGTIHQLRKISAALGMGLEDFLDALEARIETVKANRVRLESQVIERVIREDNEDLADISAGRIPTPRLPGLRPTSLA